MSEFSYLLSATVESLELTQAAAEKLTGIDRTVLSKLMSGAIPPSARNLTLLFERLSPGTNAGYELVFAHLRDELAKAGIPAHDVIIRQRAGDETLIDWWLALSSARKERLRLLDEGARADDTFDELLSDLETLALKLQAGKADSKKLDQMLKGQVYPFPKSPVSLVAEDRALPTGPAQEPTA